MKPFATFAFALLLILSVSQGPLIQAQESTESSIPSREQTTAPEEPDHAPRAVEPPGIEDPPSQPAASDSAPIAPPAPPMADSDNGWESESTLQRPQEQRHWNHSAGPIFGRHVLVRSNETVRELVLIGGSAEIQGTVERDLVAIGASVDLSGTVGGDVVVVGGRAKFSGQVDRDTVVVVGSVELTDSARLEGDAVLIGGPINIAETSYIGGERVMMPIGDFLPQVEWLKAWLTRGLLWGRLLTFHIAWPWAVAGVFLAIYLVTLLIFPAAARGVYRALEERPVTSIVSGLLTLILFAPLAFLLVISVAGILVIPFLKIALLLALLFGKVGLICFVGRSIGRGLGAASFQAPILAFVAGAILLTLSYAIPLFGILAWAMATVFGLGGAIVALSNTFNREDGYVPPAPVRVSTLQPSPASALAGAPATAAATGVVPAASEPIPGAGADTMAAPPSLYSIAAMNPDDTVLLPRAGFWKRLLAAALDLILLSLILPVVGPLFVPIAVVYFVAMWTWKGTTIGSIVLGLKVVRTDGQPMNFAVALVRSLASLFSAVVLFLGFIWSAWDREKQTWHDKIAGTVVVRMPKDFALI